MVNGQLRPTAARSGSTARSWSAASRATIWRLGVGRTFQIAETFASLTVVENVQMALLSDDAKLLSFWRCRRAPVATRRSRCSTRSACGAGRAAVQRAGLRRRQAGRARDRDGEPPKLLLMDEPTAGMAPKERNDLMALTKQLVVDRGIGGALHRAQHGRRVRACRPDDRAGARRADRRRHAGGDTRPRPRCRRSISAAARPSRRPAGEASHA